MRMTTQGHMVFGSEREATAYASNAGFKVTVHNNLGTTTASRPDMQSKFALSSFQKGNHYEFMWYRPIAEIG